MFNVTIFYIVVLAAVVSTILVPFVAQLSVKIGVLDVPDDRKVHSMAISRLGGIAIFCGFLFTAIVFMDMDTRIRGVLAGAIVMFLVGLADDISGLTPRQKFAGEFVAAGLAVFMGGVCVRHLGSPFGLGPLELGPFGIPFTLLGIVGLINAINLLDGLDGLAGGVCAIACVSFCIIAFVTTNPVLFSCSAALLGALLGFLRHNTHPARIFMGDGGSLLLGYCMGVFSVLVTTGGEQPVSPYVPLLILGVPILDTLVVMTKRRLAGRRIFQPDMSHLHHRLLDLGIGHRYTVLIVYGVTYLLNLIGILGRSLSDTLLFVLLLGITASLYLLLRYLSSHGGVSQIYLASNASLRKSISYRKLVRQSGFCAFMVKYLIIGVLLLPAFLSTEDVSRMWYFPLLLVVSSIAIYLMQSGTWQNQLLQTHIYITGAYLIYVLENYGRDDTLLGYNLHIVSHGVFTLLLICVVVKTMLRNRTSRLVTSPLEYLVMLIVLTIPLLPKEFVGNSHLLTVAAKSVILFVAFKLILMHQMKRNRKILLALLLSCLLLAVRALML